MKHRIAVLCATFVSTSGVFAQNQIVLNPIAARAVGQQQLVPLAYAVNLVEGKEVNSPQAVAVDSSRNVLYVSDTANNRIMVWNDASGFNIGAFADRVLGQRDKASVDRLGPGTSLSTGLNTPSGIAVDSGGRLWVVDTGNNRILRYTNPLSSSAPDRVIGQDNFSLRNANQGSSIGRRGISTNPGNNANCERCLQAGLVFDSDGNLWFTDSGNNRVLRYPAASLDSNNPEADLVLGQPDFVTSTAPQGSQAVLSKTQMLQPATLAFDNRGNLYVGDSLNRVIVYRSPVTASKAADRLMGINLVPQGQSPPPNVNEVSFNAGVSGTSVGVFAINDVPFVVDTLGSRILRFPPLDQWPAETTTLISPTANAVIGQDTSRASVSTAAQILRLANRGRPEPNQGGFDRPSAAVFARGEVFVADAGNNRVLALPNLAEGGSSAAGTYVTTGPPWEARRVLGQMGFEFRAPNQIEGKEMYGPAGVAVDKRSDPPRLYIADTGNNRILGYRDARKVRPGDYADLVIGQPDFRHSLANWPTGDPNRPTSSNLAGPTGLAVDASGNLWVTDTLNGRVLRFPRPFERGNQEADLVLGKPDFTSPPNTDVNQTNMVSPVGIAFTQDGSVLVADGQLHRVLFFMGSKLRNGVAADSVLGQSDFSGFSSGSTNNRMNTPRHLAVDTDDRLYVADGRNNRVLIFDSVRGAQALVSGRDAAISLDFSTSVGSRLNSPVSVAVNDTTGEIWVTDWSSGGRLLRYKPFRDLDILNPNVADPQNILSALLPQAISFDGYGNLFVADSANRVAIYFQAFRLTNGANFARAAQGSVGGQRVVAGSWMSAFSLGTDFPAALTVGPSSPSIPTTLEDIQVFVNEKPAPVWVVSPRQINFVVPWDAPDSGAVEVRVEKKSTQQILAVGCTTVRTAGAGTVDPGDDRFACLDLLGADVASPALFTYEGGTGQVAAFNEDGTINGAGAGQSAIQRGKIIQMFGTGQGKVPNAPADGVPAPAALSPTNDTPEVVIGTSLVPVIYSGLAPGLVGVWQINVRIPDTVAPGNAVAVGLRYRGIVSNLQNPCSAQNPGGICTTIAVRQ